MNNDITQWEYKQIDGGEKELNELGKEGWEAVAARGYGVIMKRPKTSNKAKEADCNYGYSR